MGPWRLRGEALVFGANVTIRWTEDLAVGVAQIDDQHRSLYEQIAALHADMRAYHLQGVGATLEFLQRYVLDHFATEERLMEAAAYPRLAQHRALHEAFVQEFLRHREACSGSPPRASAVLELAEWLGTWLRQHVRGTDKEMGRYLRER